MSTREARSSQLTKRVIAPRRELIESPHRYITLPFDVTSILY